MFFFVTWKFEGFTYYIYLFWAYFEMFNLEICRNGPSFWDNIEAVPKRIARAERVPIGRAVRKRSKAVPVLVCVPGRITPEIGRPVAVRGLELLI